MERLKHLWNRFKSSKIVERLKGFCKIIKLSTKVGIVLGIVEGIVEGIVWGIVVKILSVIVGEIVSIGKGLKDEIDVVKKIENSSIQDLLIELKQPIIKGRIVNKIVNKLCEKKTEEIFEELKKLKIEELFCIKGTITSGEKLNNEVEKSSFKILGAVGTLLISNVLISVYSKTAIIETSFNLSFFGYKKALVDNSVLDTIIFGTGYFFIFLIILWGISINSTELNSIQTNLINMIDYIIELEKEKEKKAETSIVTENNDTIETELIEVLKVLEIDEREGVLKIKIENKKAPVKNTSAEK